MSETVENKGGLLEQWHFIAYEKHKTQQDANLFWAGYFNLEKEVYQKLLTNLSEGGVPVEGTVKELSEKYGISVLQMTGFLDGIQESLKNPNPIEETLAEDTKVSLDFDTELLYKNMVEARADWLYGLEEWAPILSEEKRAELYKEQRNAHTVVKDKKIGRNDPCPCGSGRKYKQCCMNK